MYIQESSIYMYKQESSIYMYKQESFLFCLGTTTGPENTSGLVGRSTLAPLSVGSQADKEHLPTPR